MESLAGLQLGATRSDCVLRRCLWLQVESGLQGKHDRWGVTTARFMKEFPSHDLRAPPFQAGIAAPHFAELETEALGGEMPSKAGSSGAGPRPRPVLILLTLAPCPSPSIFLSRGYVWGLVSAKDRGPAVLLLPGIRPLEPEDLGLHLVSAT